MIQGSVTDCKNLVSQLQSAYLNSRGFQDFGNGTVRRNQQEFSGHQALSRKRVAENKLLANLISFASGELLDQTVTREYIGYGSVRLGLVDVT